MGIESGSCTKFSSDVSVACPVVGSGVIKCCDVFFCGTGTTTIRGFPAVDLRFICPCM